MLRTTFAAVFLLTVVFFDLTTTYSAFEDAKIISEFVKNRPTDHAKVARTLVHQANWSSVGTLSTNPDILGCPMVNIVSVDDNAVSGESTGKIHFMLTDLDFTGPDWRSVNKVTFMFTDEQNKNCRTRGEDPMEPTCPRTIISGKVIEMNKNQTEYPDALAAFQKRHPASVHWMKAHMFYLCELQIENIFVLDYYGGPHKVSAEQYYKVHLDFVAPTRSTWYF